MVASPRFSCAAAPAPLIRVRPNAPRPMAAIFRRDLDNRFMSGSCLQSRCGRHFRVGITDPPAKSRTGLLLPDDNPSAMAKPPRGNTAVKRPGLKREGEMKLIRKT